jgi:tRNA/tmRNA/rRNA uracil-C5-methylase (TrmA/RlmC/RlmD family)
MILGCTKVIQIIFFLTLGMTSSLVVYFSSSESALIEYARAGKTSLSQYFQQVNFRDFKNQAKTEEAQEGQNQMPQSDQVLHLLRQVPKPLDSTYPHEHILVQSNYTSTDSEIPKLQNYSILKTVSKLSYMQPKGEVVPKVLVDDKKHQISRSINIYDTSKPSVYDPNSCAKTTTPKRFIICTYSKMEDIYVSGDILKHGQWERTITHLLYNILSQDRPITFLDIGANIGYFSLLAAAAGQSVISVEPTILHIQKLTSSIQANKFENDITVLNNAVSNERRTVKMDVSNRTNKGTFRLVSDSEHLNMTEYD